VAAASPARVGTANGQSSYSPFENNELNDSTIAGFLNIAHELDDRTAVLNGAVQSLHQMMYDQKEEITRQNKERDERDRRFEETLNRIAAAQSKPAQAEMIRPPVSTPPHASSQYARTGGPPVFALRAIPDTAPRPNYNFTFPQASRTRVPTNSTPPMQFEHLVRPSFVTWDSKKPVPDAWDALVAGDPYQVASLYQESPCYETILQVLKSNASVSGTVWHHRVLHIATTVSKWVTSQISAVKNSMHYQLQRLGDLSNLKYPKALTSASPEEVAKAWDQFRLKFIRLIEAALHLGCESMEIFRALIVSASNSEHGNPKLNAFLLQLRLQSSGLPRSRRGLVSILPPQSDVSAEQPRPLLPLPRTLRHILH
jgi:hypothetical protein